VLLEELPHRAGGVDILCGFANNYSGKVASTWPGMPAPSDGVKNQITITIRIFYAADISACRQGLRVLITAITPG
jgi:hypothetical protein